MSNTRYLGRSLLLSLFLLAETGCSTSSLRNLFVWNRKGDYHTLEELNSAQKKTADTDEKQSESVKTASWNPFNRKVGGSVAADSSAEAEKDEVAAVEKQGSGFRMPFGGEDASNEDPFLKDESAQDRMTSPVKRKVQSDDEQNGDSSSRTARSSERPIRRTAAAARSESIAETDTAEPLITERPARSTGRPVRSELEERKLAELDALLEGRELTEARQAGRTAVASASRNAAAVKRSTELAARNAREAAAEKKEAAETAARDLQKSLADAELVIGETEPSSKMVGSRGRGQDHAEPLILRRPQAKRAIAENSAIDESSEESEADESTEESDSDTAVAAAEKLFGDLQSGRKFAAREIRNAPAADARIHDREFGWKSSEPAASSSRRDSKLPRSGAEGNQGPLRLAGLQQEIGPEDEAEEPLPTLDPLENTENTPDFDESHVSVPPRSAPTTGNRVRSNAFPSADPFMVPALPQKNGNSPGPSVDAWEEDQDSVKREDREGPDAGAVAASVSGGGGDWMPLLSARTWVLAAGGLTVLALLFLPNRRRMTNQQTPVRQTSIA